MKPPFKILYSNDLTHIETCVSPYHREGERFTRAMLEASVDETADVGVDVHMLQPGFGWMPLWPSKAVPPASHWAWLRKQCHAQRPDAFFEYVLEGGDIVADFVRRCRERRMAPFLSLRLNDTHHLDKLGTPRAAEAQLNVSEFYQSHPEYRLETASNSWRDRGHNWAIREAREYKFRFLREWCEGYDLDGIELDLMRFPALFRSYETTLEQRRSIFTGFVAEVRKLLDATARAGQHRWLSLRIPVDPRVHDSVGLDVGRLADVGAEMFNLSCSYFTAQDENLAALRRQAPGAAMYVEMTNCASVGRPVEKGDGDHFEFIATTKAMYHTTAMSALEAGMDGVSLFNFVYYRKHGSRNKQGANAEPPFNIIPSLRDREGASQEPSCYFIGSHWEDDGALPKSMCLFGQYARFAFRNVRRHDRPNALLRVHLDHDEAGDWEIWFNDRPVAKVSPQACPWAMVRPNASILAWEVPVSWLREGENVAVLRSCNVAPSVIDFVELLVW